MDGEALYNFCSPKGIRTRYLVARRVPGHPGFEKVGGVSRLTPQGALPPDRSRGSSRLFCWSISFARCPLPLGGILPPDPLRDRGSTHHPATKCHHPSTL